MTLLKDYHHFDGLAWATGYPTNVLAYQGVKAPHTGQPYTEAMLMGINGGLCMGYFSFEYEGHAPHTHILTRYIFDETPGALFERLGIPMNAQATLDPEKAIANVLNALAKGLPVVAWVDMASLAYNFGMGTNFTRLDDRTAGEEQAEMWLIMPVVVYGYDRAAGVVHLADRARVGLQVSAEQFAQARTRLAKVKNRIMTLGAPNPDKLPAAILAGIQACIDIFSGKSPQPSNFGFEGYKRWATLLRETKNKKAWAKEYAPGPRMYNGLVTAYESMELWYTGGRGARHLYADFLDEAAVVLNNAALREVGTQFREAAACWEALSAALLPEGIAPFRQARDLMTRNYHLFVSQGAASLEERKRIVSQLRGLRAQMKADFPLSEAQAATMRSELAERVMAIHDVEVVALDMLRHATA
jgi:hypothetical protein